MGEGFERLRAYLDAEGVSYHLIHHPADYRARQTAEDTATPPEDFAKTVFVWIDGKPLTKDIDVATLAKLTPGFVGAVSGAASDWLSSCSASSKAALT